VQILEKDKEGARGEEYDDAFICISVSLIMPLTVTMSRLM
jgi:hypothetical protein